MPRVAELDAREQTIKEREASLQLVDRRHEAKERELELRLLALEEMEQYNARVVEKCSSGGMRCC